jgi:hypothetical protein
VPLAIRRLSIMEHEGGDQPIPKRGRLGPGDPNGEI